MFTRRRIFLSYDKFPCLNIAFLTCCLLIIGNVSSMSLDRLRRQYQHQNDKHLKFSETVLPEANSEELQNDLELVPVDDDNSDMYLLVPAATNNQQHEEQDSFWNNANIESDSDMLMLESEDKPAMEILELPKDVRELQKDIHSEQEMINIDMEEPYEAQAANSVFQAQSEIEKVNEDMDLQAEESEMQPATIEVDNESHDQLAQESEQKVGDTDMENMMNEKIEEQPIVLANDESDKGNEESELMEDVKSMEKIAGDIKKPENVDQLQDDDQIKSEEIENSLAAKKTKTKVSAKEEKEVVSETQVLSEEISNFSEIQAVDDDTQAKQEFLANGDIQNDSAEEILNSNDESKIKIESIQPEIEESQGDLTKAEDTHANKLQSDDVTQITENKSETLKGQVSAEHERETEQVAAEDFEVSQSHDTIQPIQESHPSEEVDAISEEQLTGETQSDEEVQQVEPADDNSYSYNVDNIEDTTASKIEEMEHLEESDEKLNEYQLAAESQIAEKTQVPEREIKPTEVFEEIQSLADEHDDRSEMSDEIQQAVEIDKSDEIQQVEYIGKDVEENDMTGEVQQHQEEDKPVKDVQQITNEQGDNETDQTENDEVQIVKESQASEKAKPTEEELQNAERNQSLTIIKFSEEENQSAEVTQPVHDTQPVVKVQFMEDPQPMEETDPVKETLYMEETQPVKDQGMAEAQPMEEVQSVDDIQLIEEVEPIEEAQSFMEETQPVENGQSAENMQPMEEDQPAQAEHIEDTRHKETQLVQNTETSLPEGEAKEEEEKIQTPEETQDDKDSQDVNETEAMREDLRLAEESQNPVEGYLNEDKILPVEIVAETQTSVEKTQLMDKPGQNENNSVENSQNEEVQSVVLGDEDILQTIESVAEQMYQKEQIPKAETENPLDDKDNDNILSDDTRESKPIRETTSMLTTITRVPTKEQLGQKQQKTTVVETISSTTLKPLLVLDSVLNYVNTSFMNQMNSENSDNKNLIKQEVEEKQPFSSKLRRYDGAQVWRIVVQNDEEKQLADELQTKFDGQLWKEVRQEVDYLLKPQVLADAERYVKAANLSRIVLIDNLQKVIEVENPTAEEIAQLQNRKGHRLTWKAYHRLEDIHGFFDYLAKTYPDICSVETIGYSIEKRPLKILKISDGNANNPGIWIDGGMHAREWISPAVVTYITNQIVEGWDDLPAYMRNINWYIHAVANPDGYEYSHTTDRLWRKNMRSHGRFCPGVDLNRNFGYKWGGKGTSANPCAQTYRGTTAFSEPETFYISKFISNFPRDTFKAYLSFHSYGQYILYPWGYDYKVTPDMADLDLVARQAGTIITKSRGDKYTVGSSASTLYPAAGGSDDWAKGIAGIKYTYTIEMGDTGRYGFVLPAEYIESNGKNGLTFVDTMAKVITMGKNGRRRRLKARQFH